MAGSALLVWGLVQVGESGWDDGAALAGLLGGLAVLACFVAWERRTGAPMLPLRLFRSRTFTAASIAAFMSFGAIMAAAFLTAQYFQLGLGYSPLGPGCGCSRGLRPRCSSPRWPARSPTGSAPGRCSSPGWPCRRPGSPGSPRSRPSEPAGYGRFVLPFVIAGVGISMAIPTVPTAALGAVAPGDVGRASGVSNTMQRFGGAFGIALASAIFAAHGHLGSAASFTAGYRPAMLGAVALSAAGSVASIAIAGRRRAASSPADTERLASARRRRARCDGGLRRAAACRDWACSLGEILRGA